MFLFPTPKQIACFHVTQQVTDAKGDMLDCDHEVTPSEDGFLLSSVECAQILISWMILITQTPQS